MNHDYESAFTVEEEEEEIYTFDPKSNMFTTMESSFITLEKNSNVITNNVIAEIKPTYKDKLSDLFINKLTAQALSSLLVSCVELDREMQQHISARKIGGLGTLLESQTEKMFDVRREELRQALVGNRVEFEKIPEWAKSYIEEYVSNSVMKLGEER